MFDFFHDLPLAHKILVIEFAVCGVIALFYIQRGRQQSQTENAAWFVEDVVVLLLFIIGGANFSWQHILLSVLIFWALFSNLFKALGWKEIKPVKQNDVGFFLTVFSVALFSLQTYLLVAG